MVYKGQSSLPDHVCVVFELPASLWADRVYVAGDFNNWNHQAHPLQQNRDGSWRTALDLPVGKSYQYRYWVDGRWQADCRSHNVEPIDIHAKSALSDQHVSIVDALL